MKPAILDIEASGFGEGSYPIEIGIVLPDSDSYSFLIKPEPGWTHWDETAEKIHGISRTELEQKGRPAWDIASLLNNLLSGKKIYSDAWAHDYVWLNQLFDSARLIPRFRFDSIISLLNPAQIDSWNSEKERQFSMTQSLRHRAVTDARIIQNTVIELTSTGIETHNEPEEIYRELSSV